jgi:glycerophosphoryl diester phosphodiesterase
MHIKPIELNQLIAHRGASAYAPENTMAAFNQAHQMGARWVEFDVMLSADGLPFVFHDDKLKRTTNGRGEFGKVSADYIRSLDAGSWFSKRFQGERIPSFSTVLQWLCDHQMQANIEIKPFPGMVEQTTVAVLAHLNQYWPHDRALPLVSSFELEALTLCRSLSPEIPLGYLLHEWQNDWLKTAQNLQCYAVHLNAAIATPARIDAIKAEGYKVLVYTVNQPRRAQKFLAYGVDAIFTDYPDLLGLVNAPSEV